MFLLHIWVIFLVFGATDFINFFFFLGGGGSCLQQILSVPRQIKDI